MAPTVAQLKEDGNALFINNDFAHAYKKYTEAIALDGQNAVLYANRSACSYAMGRYLNAMRDARQATKIDPTYAKGWSRFATANEAALYFASAVEAWKRAVDALPKKDLSPAELKQKEQYTASLQKAKERLQAASSQPPSGIVALNENTGKLSWQAAAEILPELMPAGRAKYPSSAYVIYFANKEFTEGVQCMKSLEKVKKNTEDGFQMIGNPEALTYITNGLLRDMRAFRIDCVDWFDKYNDQLYFEATKYKAWITVTECLESVQQKALERLKKEGWSEVRPALSVVVRGWIMRAIFDSNLRRIPHMAVERLRETLDLLHWGREVWRDVSMNDRGVIFQDTFIRGVKALYLETLIGAHTTANNDEKPTFLAALLKEARELIKDFDESPSPGQLNLDEPLDPGFALSFYVYPVAEAHAAIGYYFVQLAMFTADPVERMTHYNLAIKHYTTAAQVLPQDDERFCWYLHCTINPMLQSGAHKSTVMEIAKMIRVAMPKMQRIWGNSVLANDGRDALIEKVLRIAEARCG